MTDSSSGYIAAVYTINNVEREQGRPHTSVSARLLTWSKFPLVRCLSPSSALSQLSSFSADECEGYRIVDTRQAGRNGHVRFQGARVLSGYNRGGEASRNKVLEA